MKQTKHYKRILAAILAAVLTVGMSLTAFAGDETPETPATETSADTAGSITITNPKDGITYYGYKIFDVTYAKAGDTKSYSYTIKGDSDWYAAVAAYAIPAKGLKLDKAAGANEYVVTTTDGVFSAADFANHLKNNLGSISHDFIMGPKGESDKELKKSDLELGYYFVLSRDGAGETQALCNLTTTDPDAEIKDKNDTEFKKEIAEVDSADVTGTDPVTNQSVQVGSVLTYKITGDIPDRSGAETYYYHAKDTMSKGLKFQKPVTVTIGGRSITLEEAENIDDSTTGDKVKYYDPGEANGGGFELSLDLMKKQDDSFLYQDGDKIVITYKVTVTKDAVEQIGENEATLKYGTDPADLAESTPQQVRTWSSKIEVDKYEDEGGAANTDKPLAGAKFVLKKKGADEYYKATKEDGAIITSTEGAPVATTVTDLAKVEWVTPIDLDEPGDLSKITVLTTDEQGKAVFAGLANGVYELIEVEAPAGYNLLKDPTTVEIFTVAGEGTGVTLTVKSGKIEDEKDLEERDKLGVKLENYTEQLVTAQVLNKSGSLLPSTGGIGTTIFYVLGSVLLVAAAAWFVISRRKVQVEDK